MSSSVSSSTYTTPTGMTGAGGGDMLRLVGLNSGLDVDSIVKKMMAVEQTKIDKVKQQQQLLQWRQDGYKDIINSVRDLQSTYFDSLNSDTYILSSNFFSDYSTTSTDPTFATATAGVGAKAGVYTISVGTDQFAKSAVKDGSSLNLSSTVSSDWSDKTISFIINGGNSIAIKLDDNLSSNSSIADNINSKINAFDALRGKVKAVPTTDGKIQFQTLTDSFVMLSGTTVISDLDNLNGRILNPSLSNTLSDIGFKPSSYDLNLKCNGSSYTITLNSNDTIDEAINKINTKTNGTVTASFNQLTDSFTLRTTLTGSSQTLQVLSTSSTDTDVLTSLGLSSDPDNNYPKGSDAVVDITPPGTTTAITVNKSSNNFTIDGMSYNILKSGTATITVSKDTDKAYKKISDFIDKYNSVIDKIQTKLNEKQDSNNRYAPLTDSQKSQMSASEISAWEDKAKVGILNNDDNLQNLMDNLRSAFTTSVTGNILTFGTYGTNPIGIDTYDDFNQGGKIYISNKSELMDAINNHTDQLSSFFTGSSDLTDTTDKYNAEGVFTRINDIILNNVGNVGTFMNNAVLTKYANFQDDFSSYGDAGDDNTLPDQIYNQKLLLDKLNDEYSTKQESYYNEFSGLETAMQTLNAQSSYLSNMLS